jgi:hypothetical protein
MISSSFWNISTEDMICWGGDDSFWIPYSSQPLPHPSLCKFILLLFVETSGLMIQFLMQLMSKEEEEAVIEKKEKVPDVETVEVKPRKRKVADVDVVEKKPRMEKLGSVEMSEKKPKKGKVADVEIKEGRGGAKHKQKVSKMISRQKVVSSSDDENSSGESEDNKKLDDEEPAAEIDESDDGSSFKKTLKVRNGPDI